MALDQQAKEHMDKILSDLLVMRKKYDTRLLAVALLHYAVELLSDLIMARIFTVEEVRKEMQVATEGAVRSREDDPSPKVVHRAADGGKVTLQ